MNDKSANVQVFIIISYNMTEIYALLDFLEFFISLPALVLVDLLAHHLLYPIIDRSLPHTFKLFTTLLHIVTFSAFFLCRFHAILLRCYTLSPPGVFILHFLSTFIAVYCH